MINFTGKTTPCDADTVSDCCRYPTWGFAETDYPGCSVYWDIDNMQAWAEDKDIKIEADSAGVLTVFRGDLNGYVEFRRDPVPHWVTLEDIRSFNYDYTAHSPFFK